MEQRVSLITLAAEAPETLAAFYEALGWKRVESPDGIIVFDLIGQVLGIYGRAAMADELGIEESEIGGFSGVTLAHNLPDRAAVDSLTARVKDAGGTILKPPQEVFWGGYHAYISDPEGHVWELAHNPFSKLGPKGEFRWGGY